MSSMREEADAVARAPGFWPKFQQPTKLAEAIQMPLHDPNWQARVLNGYALTKLQTAQAKP